MPKIFRTNSLFMLTTLALAACGPNEIEEAEFRCIGCSEGSSSDSYGSESSGYDGYDASESTSGESTSGGSDAGGSDDGGSDDGGSDGGGSDDGGSDDGGSDDAGQPAPVCAVWEGLGGDNCVDQRFHRTIAGDPLDGQNQQWGGTVEIDHLKLIKGDNNGQSYVYVIWTHHGSTRPAVNGNGIPVKLEVFVHVDNMQYGSGCNATVAFPMGQNMYDGEVWEGYVPCNNGAMKACDGGLRSAAASVGFNGLWNPSPGYGTPVPALHYQCGDQDPPPAVPGSSACGDGVLNAGETCEKQYATNTWPADCDPMTCGRDRRIFVTSTKYSAALGGVAGADAKCQAAAAAVPALAGGQWQAWTSDSTKHAKDRLAVAGYGGEFVDVQGNVVAESGDDLRNGVLQRGIDFDEHGVTVGGPGLPYEFTWTCTDTQGSSLHWSQDTCCHDWSSASPAHIGFGGRAGVASTQWSQSIATLCSQTLRLVCIEK